MTLKISPAATDGDKIRRAANALLWSDKRCRFCGQQRYKGSLSGKYPSERERASHHASDCHLRVIIEATDGLPKS
jgi:hypothetical protein